MKRLSIATLAALAIAATIPSSSFADEPANPVKGAVRKVYNFFSKSDIAKTRVANFVATAREVKTGERTPYLVGVDNADSFKSPEKMETAMWTGFLKRNSGGVYTFVVSTKGNERSPRYSLWINGRQVISAESMTTSVDVNLNPGFNDLCLIVDYYNHKDVEISIKKKDSLKEPKNIGPGDLWHEDEPEDEDDEDDD